MWTYGQYSLHRVIWPYWFWWRLIAIQFAKYSIMKMQHIIVSHEISFLLGISSQMPITQKPIMVKRLAINKVFVGETISSYKFVINSVGTNYIGTNYDGTYDPWNKIKSTEEINPVNALTMHKWNMFYTRITFPKLWNIQIWQMPNKCNGIYCLISNSASFSPQGYVPDIVQSNYFP